MLININSEMIDTTLVENIKTIYRRMSHAAMRVERNPEDVKLIAVTKTVDTERIKEAIDWGLRIFGGTLKIIDYRLWTTDYFVAPCWPPAKK
jgi:hypothetical protein